MRYAIIENEFFALQSLKTVISRLRPDATLVFTAESVRECVAYFNGSPDVDLVFMDIELVDGNCFEILAQASITVPVVFTTAYDHYALQAFTLDAVDYVLKPVTEESLLKALDKYDRRQMKPAMHIDAEILRRFTGADRYPMRVLTVDGDGYSFMETDGIAYFYAEDKYTFAAGFKGERVMTFYPTITKLEEEMDPKTFFRLSRKILTSIRAVKSVRKYFNGRLKVTLSGGSEDRVEIISSTRRQAFLEWLGASGG